MTAAPPQYFPDKEIGYYWLTVCSVAAGGFGVVAGGYITDRLQARCGHVSLYTRDTRATRGRFGLHSRLWVQSGFLVLATPFAALTIYLEPPYCFIALGGSCPLHTRQ